MLVWGGSEGKTELIKWKEWNCCFGLLLLFLLSPKEEIWRVYLLGDNQQVKKMSFFCFPVQAECFYLISTEQSGGCWVVWPEGCWALQGEEKWCFLNPCDTLNKEGSVFRSALMQGSGVSSE